MSDKIQDASIIATASDSNGNDNLTDEEGIEEYSVTSDYSNFIRGMQSSNTSEDKSNSNSNNNCAPMKTTTARVIEELDLALSLSLEVIEIGPTSTASDEQENENDIIPHSSSSPTFARSLLSSPSSDACSLSNPNLSSPPQDPPPTPSTPTPSFSLVPLADTSVTNVSMLNHIRSQGKIIDTMSRDNAMLKEALDAEHEKLRELAKAVADQRVKAKYEITKLQSLLDKQSSQMTEMKNAFFAAKTSLIEYAAASLVRRGQSQSKNSKTESKLMGESSGK